MTSRFKVTVVDYDTEKSNSNFRGVPVTSANYDAQVALADAIVSAIDGVSIAEIDNHDFTSRATDLAPTPPTNQFAQRETKWLVSMIDTSGNPSNVEIGGADLGLLTGGSDELDLSAGAGLALKDAIEAYHRSLQGNTVTVQTVRHVGRNL